MRQACRSQRLSTRGSAHFFTDPVRDISARSGSNLQLGHPCPIWLLSHRGGAVLPLAVHPADASTAALGHRVTHASTHWALMNHICFHAESLTSGCSPGPPRWWHRRMSHLITLQTVTSLHKSSHPCSVSAPLLKAIPAAPASKAGDCSGRVTGNKFP